VACTSATEARIVTVEGQLDLRAIGQLADNFIKGVGRGGDLTGDLDTGRNLVGDFHIQIGRRKGQSPVAGRQKDVGENGYGVAALNNALHMSQSL
jgi:hypothetical protein